MTAILEPPTATAKGSPAPALRPRPVLPPVVGPPPAPPEQPEAREPRVQRTLTATGVRLVGAALVALYLLDNALLPPANGPEPALSVALELLLTVMTFLIAGALVGFLRGRRWALPTALVFGGLEAINVALCPAVGHHVIGLWWYAQIGVVALMVALPAVVLARTRAG